MMLTLLIAGLALAMGQQESTGTIRGRVLDLFGNPIIGAEVLVSTDRRIDRRLVTDQQGVYEASGLTAGSYSISAALRGFHAAKRTTYLGPGEQVVVELGLQPGRLGPVERETIITGIVRQKDRKPVEDATITIMSAFNQEIRQQINASSAGRFELKVAEPGQYVIYVYKPGLAVAAKAITVPTKLPKESLVVDFELSSLSK